LRPRLIKLPDIEDKTKINIRYPLIPPFAYAHIYWNHQTKELVYAIEEPELSEQEKELLKLIKVGLEEMLTISFAKLMQMRLIIEYLEKNVQAILIELGVKITKETYQNIMYYAYRDSVGFNKIEPMLKDYYIEDIECNGVGFPIYIVHRKFENLRTNVEYEEYDELADFIEKLAQKTGRYVSYAQPLLDGALPDGSRVNATYSRDVTTRGPTFTIRKFTKEPWTPIHLIDFKTGSAESFAYLWLAIENKFNVMVIGETGSGKTTFLNSIVSFIPPSARICSIEDTRELNLAHDNWLPSVQRMGFGIPNIAGERYGEVSLFDLLKESFRQNPDYVIVGEVRGKEAYVLFQGMASGHPSFGTFHSGSVENLIRRLETPPINLSASLVETLDIVCVTIHEKTPEKNIRRLRSLEEIEAVKQTPVGEAETRTLFEWNPATDIIKYNANSLVFEKIMKRTGIGQKELEIEFQRRKQLLDLMHKKGLINFRQFNDIINRYYKNAKQVLKEFGIK
jgi:flagellar protein FlaI